MRTDPDELCEEKVHPVLDHLLEDDEFSLDERRAQHLHDFLLLPTLVA